MEHFVKWKDLSEEDTTWDSEQVFQHLDFQLVGEKRHPGGEDYYNVPSQLFS